MKNKIIYLKKITYIKQPKSGINAKKRYMKSLVYIQYQAIVTTEFPPIVT